MKTFLIEDIRIRELGRNDVVICDTDCGYLSEKQSRKSIRTTTLVYEPIKHCAADGEEYLIAAHSRVSEKLVPCIDAVKTLVNDRVKLIEAIDELHEANEALENESIKVKKQCDALTVTILDIKDLGFWGRLKFLLNTRKAVK